eukprot:scaffold44215_cov69-Phaeocystis_antarctica.AAC.3
MDRPATNLTVANLPLIKVVRRPSCVPRATIHVRCRDGPARAGHAAPLHRVHPWGVGDPSLASQPMQRARSGDAGGLRRDIAAAVHTHKSSGSPGPPCHPMDRP